MNLQKTAEMMANSVTSCQMSRTSLRTATEINTHLHAYNQLFHTYVM